MARIVGEFREQLRRARAEMKGEARSRAVMIKQAQDIPEFEAALKRRQGLGHAPRPIKGAIVRDVDGAPKMFFDDGSLRHAMGFKPGKAARKAIKRARRKLRAEGRNV